MSFAFAARCRWSLVVLLTLAAPAAFGSACSVPPRVKTSTKNASAVARHRTYAIALSDTPPSGYRPAARSRTVIEKAWPRVDAELGRRGYVAAAAGDADLVVRISAGVRTVVDQPTGAAAAAGAPATTDEVSTLFVDILDRRTSENLYTGVASKEIHASTVKDEDVSSAIAQILEPVPASTQ